MTTSHPNRCEQCGGPLTESVALAGSCPRCMMEIGVDSGVTGKTEPYSTSSPKSLESGKPLHVSSTSGVSPRVIGRYRILRLIGEGGMGIVYEAEQDLPRRIVALKIIKPGLATPELLRRFEQESQALGRLQHPGIAQVYEAGTADTGFGPQPYFAMEFIQGKNVKDYAEERNLNTRQCLEMVAKIADAVQHAHQRGLIHRDLKPANILVDETGQPKILDFGVARAIDSDTQATSQTDMGQLVGTLAYMSPEQVLGDPLGLDTRSDVYALGVILYELLAGRMPYTISRKLDETIHVIREEDPARLSQISRNYRGDIETIVAKALEKDKERRYGSAAELAADITRYLKDDPIMARPPSAGYQIQKFARRHKTLVAGVAAVFVVLLAGIAASTWLAVRATNAEAEAGASRTQAQRERDNAVTEKQRADNEAAIAQALNEFLEKDLLGMANPLTQAEASLAGQTAVTPNPNLTVRAALDLAAAKIDKSEKPPFVQAGLHETIGGTYLSLGLVEEAQTQLELAVALRTREQGKEHPDSLKTMSDLAAVYAIRGNLSSAVDLLRRVLEGSRRTLGDENPLTRRAVKQLVDVCKMNRPTLVLAETILADLVEHQRRTLGEDNPTTLESIRFLVDVLETDPRTNQRENPAAEAFLTALLAQQRRTLGNASPATLQSVRLLTGVYSAHHKFAEAETLLKELLRDQHRILGSTHPATVSSVNLLAAIYLTQAKFEAAEALLVPLVPHATSTSFVNGRGDLGELRTALDSMKLLIEVYRATGKSAQAQPLLETTYKLKQVAYGAGLTDMLRDEDVATRLLDVVRSAAELVRLGKHAETEKLATEAIEGFGRIAGVKNATTLLIGNAFIDLARDFGSKGKYDKADNLFMKVLDIHRTAFGTGHPTTMSMMAAEGNAYSSFGRYDKAEEMFDSLWSIQRKLLGESHPETLRTMDQLELAYWNDARSEMAAGLPERGKAKYARAAEIVTQHLNISLSVSHGEERVDSSVIGLRLGLMYGCQGQYKKAEEVFFKLRNAPRPLGGAFDPFNGEFRDIVAHLGWALLHQEKYAEAELVLRDLEPFWLPNPSGPGSPLRHNWEGILGASLVAQQRYAEAEPRLLNVYEGITRGPARPWSPGIRRPKSPILFTAEEAGAWILRLYQEWGKPEKVIEWQKKLQVDKTLLGTQSASVLAIVCQSPQASAKNDRKE